jgi:hypothetical protein
MAIGESSILSPIFYHQNEAEIKSAVEAISISDNGRTKLLGAALAETSSDP